MPRLTADLRFDASPGEVAAALNALPSISAGGGHVSVSSSPGNAPGTTPFVYIVSFDAGPLAQADVAQLSASDGTTPLSGGDPATDLAVATRADGSAGGTGLESCTSASGCKVGLAGAGAGELQRPGGIAVDASGNLYVFERETCGSRNSILPAASS